MNKSIIKILLPIFSLFGIYQSLSAQTTSFYFFIAPNNVIASNFGATLDSVNCPSGYSRILIGTSNLAKFNAIAPPNLKYVYTQLQAGAPLRKNVNDVMRNSAGSVQQVQYWLTDDRTGMTNQRNLSYYFDGGTKYVWPAANNQEYPANSKKFIGWVMIGEHQLATDQSQRTGGTKAVDEVVLHETSHTQFTGEWTKWGGVNGHAITYGSDGAHYFSIAELLGDQEGALNEGLATFYGFVMNDDAWQALLQDYTSTGYRYFVEAQSVLAGEPDLYSVKDRKSVVLTDGSGNNKKYEDGKDVVIFTYKWQSVPGWYLMFAEATSTAYFSIFRNFTYQNKDTAMSMIRYSSVSMAPERKKRFLTYACNRLALKMEEYNNSTKGKADPSRISSLFPFALLDLLTHFGMSDTEYKEDYERNLADKNPKAYTEYFKQRAAIKALVQADLAANPINFNQAIQSIVNYCKQPANIF